MCDTVDAFSTPFADLRARLSRLTSTCMQDFGQKLTQPSQFNRGSLPKSHFDLHPAAGAGVHGHRCGGAARVRDQRVLGCALHRSPADSRGREQAVAGRGAVLHHGRQPDERGGDDGPHLQLRQRAGRALQGRARAGERALLDDLRRRVGRRGGRLRGTRRHRDQGNARPRLLAGLRRGADGLLRGGGADHPALHRARDLRLSRPAVGGTDVPRRTRSRADRRHLADDLQPDPGRGSRLSHASPGADARDAAPRRRRRAGAGGAGNHPRIDPRGDRHRDRGRGAGLHVLHRARRVLPNAHPRALLAGADRHDADDLGDHDHHRLLHRDGLAARHRAGAGSARRSSR